MLKELQEFWSKNRIFTEKNPEKHK